MKTTLILSLTMISLMFGCIPQSKIVVVSNKKVFAKSISTLAIINNQLIIKGVGLEGTKTIKIQGTSFDETFTIESATSTEIVANAQRAISIGANQVFDLIISNASASATFPISITLDNGSVTAPKLAAMGAGIGQVLQYNGSAWLPANISTGQMYMGTWNATTDTPDIAASSPQAGEYYIVTTAGSQDLGAGSVSYAIGDWVIYNGTAWDKIAISNNTVASFKGRSGVVVPASGDYTWSQITKTGSKLEDILDIDITGRADGKVLKWHASSSKWIIADDDNSGGGGGGTTFSGTASRAVATDGSGALTSSAVTATELGHLSGVTSAIQTQLNAKVTSVNTETGAVVLTTGDIAESGSNLYATNARTIGATLDGFTTGSNTAIAATDTVLGAFQKVQGQITAREAAITAGTTAQYLRGDKSLSTFATDAINSALTGLSTASSTAVIATDSILVGVGKLQAQVSGQTTSLATKADSTNVTQSITASAVVGLTTPLSGSAAANRDYVDAQTSAVDSASILANGSALGSIINRMGKYAGQITLTNGSATVVGVGTSFITDDAYQFFLPNGKNYSFDEITDETNAILANPYTGPTKTVNFYRYGSEATGLGSIALGSYSLATGDNSLAILGNATGYASIAIGGQATGYSAVSIGGKGTVSLASGQYSTTIGGNKLISSGYNSVAMGEENISASLDQTTIGRFNQAKGAESASTWVATDPLFVVGNGSSNAARSNAMMILKNGHVGVGTNTPSEMIETSGNVKAVGFISTSDVRLKENITKTKGLEKVIKLQGVEYDWKKSGEHDYGLIAQAVEKVFPHAVVTDEVTGYKAVKYSNLISPVIEAIKDLFNMMKMTSSEVTQIKRELASVKVKNEKLEAQNEDMKKDLEELRKRMDRLEANHKGSK